MRLLPLSTLVPLAGVLIAVACGGAASTLEPTVSEGVDARPTPTLASISPTTATPTPIPVPSLAVSTPAPTTPKPNVPTPANSPATTSVPPPLRPLEAERAFGNLLIRNLTNLVQPAGGDDRLFVTEQSGRVLAFSDDQGTSVAQVFLDIRDRVDDSAREQGLLGLAFDPGFIDNHYFYVYYSASGPRRSVISRFEVSPSDSQLADPASELVIMEIDQPFANHNGGQIVFGPDEFLYVGLGDGGSGGDPMGNGQNTATLLGSIMRIDVSRATPNVPYVIPADNPFVADAGARQEIWAYGLRNPWRFSFDQQTGQIWAGDVGQNSLEEVDLVVRGGNYGWNTLEGTQCFSPRASCERHGAIAPVWEYSTNDGCSIIGGYVYRGTRIQSLTGAYIYGDYCSGEIWALRYDGQEITEHVLLTETGLRITSFGQDRQGNLYVLSQDAGIYRLRP